MAKFHPRGELIDFHDGGDHVDIWGLKFGKGLSWFLIFFLSGVSG